MKLRSPNGSYEMTVPNHAAWDYLRQGFTNVTPPRSPKQIAQSNRFMALGTLSRTMKCIDICIAQAQFDEVDRARLRLAQDVLSTKITSIRRESIQRKNTP